MYVALGVDVLDSLGNSLNDLSSLFFRKCSSFLNILIKRHLHSLLNDVYVLFWLKHVDVFNYVFMLKTLHDIRFVQSILTCALTFILYFYLFDCNFLSCKLVCANSDLCKPAGPNCPSAFVIVLNSSYMLWIWRWRHFVNNHLVKRIDFWSMRLTIRHQFLEHLILSHDTLKVIAS